MTENNNQASSASSGIGFVGLLTIVFITLKLTNFIDWSWWWVLSPIWLSWIFAIFCLVTFFGIFGRHLRR